MVAALVGRRVSQKRSLSAWAYGERVTLTSDYAVIRERAQPVTSASPAPQAAFRLTHAWAMPFSRPSWRLSSAQPSSQLSWQPSSVQLSSPISWRPSWRLSSVQIGRAHVWTPVTYAHLVCRFLIENKKQQMQIYHS